MAIVWPIGGGKGGSGKSFLTSSLGRLSAEMGKRTLVIDLDLGAANLHTLIGVPYPKKSFSDFVRKKAPSLEDVAMETPIPNLFLISGAHDPYDVANLPYEQKIKTLRAITKLNYEHIFIDLGAGTSFNTLDFFLISENGVFVATPEPTSIENVYRLIRAIYLRRIKHDFTVAAFREIEIAVEEAYGDDAAAKPVYLMRSLAKLHPETHQRLMTDFEGYRFNLIINQMRRHDNASLGPQICKMAKRHIGLQIDFAGNVAYDEHVHDAVCQQVAFLERYPYTKTASDLREIGKFLAQPMGRQLSLGCV